MNTTTKILFAIVCFSFLISCSNDSEDDLIDQTPIMTVTYTSHIKNIVDNNCLNCHSNPTQNGAPMPLTTYNEVRDAVLNRGLINRLNNQVNPMPPTGNLPNATIALFEQWETDGLLEQ